MDERTSSFLEQFKRRGTIYIMVPAVAVALIVAVGTGLVLMASYGRIMGSGLNGMVAGSVGTSGQIDSPSALAELESDLGALKDLGSFVMLQVSTPAGVVLASTEGNVGQQGGLTDEERAAVEHGKTTAVVRHCVECKDLELMVTAPLTDKHGTVYGVVTGNRPFALIAPSILLTTIGFALVVMIGASVALRYFRYMVNQALREVEVSERAVARLDARLNSSMHEIEEHSLGTLQALVAAVDARDAYTAQHSLNVADYACAIARQMGLDDDVELLERAALVHDIGKIGLSESLLSKPVGLTAAEYEAVKEHSEGGARIIEMLPFLADTVPLVRHHHERWDGKGYPTGLAGTGIPLLARILTVADALDAMTSDRPYRSALTLTRARTELLVGRGVQFDPDVVDATVRLIDERLIVIPHDAKSISA